MYACYSRCASRCYSLSIDIQDKAHISSGTKCGHKGVERMMIRDIWPSDQPILKDRLRAKQLHCYCL